MRRLFLILLSCLALPLGAHADSAVQKDAQIIANLLKYIHGVSVSTIGVIYDPAVSGSQRDAETLAQSLNDKDTRKLSLVSVDTLGQNPQIKFIIVTNGLASHFDAIAAKARRERIFTLSLDTKCTEQKCCVLSIDTSSGIEIYLNETLLREFGFDVDAALRFMVKRV